MSGRREMEEKAVRDTLWGMRAAYADLMNAERRAVWRAKWPLVNAADLPSAHIRVSQKVESPPPPLRYPPARATSCICGR